jgi:alpha-glucosidase
MVDFGYAVADHCDVDPVFGVLEDADVLLAEAHARGLRVVVDFVPNHTSDRHRGSILPAPAPGSSLSGSAASPDRRGPDITQRARSGHRAYSRAASTAACDPGVPCQGHA